MIAFDFEVFFEDWLVVFKEVNSTEYTTIVNDPITLEKYYKDHKLNIFFGYNNIAFDNVILSAILSGADPYATMVLLFNDMSKSQIYKALNITPVDIISFDLMQDTLGMSLKEAEGYMNMSIEESTVPFNIDRKLTKEEIEETIFYCKHDVDATIQLLSYKTDYITSKLNLIKMFDLDIRCLSYTNASLCAKILDAKQVIRDDELQYDRPSEIIINSPIYKRALDIYTNPLDYNRILEIDVAGVMHKFAYGGAHAARNNFIYEGEMWNIDITSFYPSMMLEYGYLSRNTPSYDRFKQIYDDRVRAKKQGDKGKAKAYKLVVNTTYGCMKNKYNGLYDPKMANQVCITGQLLFLDLIEKLEPYMTLVQTNTDGILIIPHNKEKVKEELLKWESRTRLRSKIDICYKIWQKDVNNYILVMEEDGKLETKTKGAYVAQYGKSFKNSAKILDLAVVDYFINKISPEETINKCNDKSLFQIICKTGSTYKDTCWVRGTTKEKVNRVNRVYASKNVANGALLKLKDNYELIANLPKHCIVDNKNTLSIDSIDKQWYISTAWNRINDFKGV